MKTGRPKIFKKLCARIVYAESDDFKYLKDKGIGVANFFRQAVAAYKHKKFEFKR